MTVLASASVHAEASYPETIRLVRSMREDELIMARQQAKLAADVKAGKAPRHAACLAQVKYPILTDAIAIVISSQLTDAEVAEGIQFYRSPLGQKILDRSYREITEQLPPGTDYLSTEEKAELGKFSKRPVGRKLLKDRITQSSAVMGKVDVRMKVAYEDCAAAVELVSEGITRPDSCRGAPLASPDNACSVEQTFDVYPPEAQIGTQTIISVDCLSKSDSLAAYKGRVDGLGLRWLDARTLEVAEPSGARREGRTGSDDFRVKFKQLPAAKAQPTRCWSSNASLEALQVQMDVPQAQSFWMSYSDKERCILTKRVDRKQMPGASRDTIVQFRRVKAPEYPFATDRLVFFEAFSTQVHTRAIRIRGAGASVTEMTPGGPRAGFHLVGAPAEQLLKQLASGAELTLEVQPATGATFTIPLPRTDFEWAHQGFAGCLRSL